MVDISWMHHVDVSGVEVDPCKVALPLRITHGRSTSGAQPDAPTCEFTWLGATPPGMVGSPITVRLELLGSGATWIYDAPNNYTYDSPNYVYDNVWNAQIGTRFKGSIAQYTANEAKGAVQSWAVSCIGTQAVFGQKHVLADRPQETDIARVLAIAGTTPITIHGTSVLQLATDTLDKDVLAAWQEVCNSSAGVVWQSPDGAMHYGTANHRQVDPVGVLTCETINDGLDWTIQVEQIVNHVTVKYGPESSQTQITVKNDASITQWNQRHVDVTTMCAAEPDASALGGVILARRAQPYWLMPGVMVEPDRATRADQVVLAGLDVGKIILLPADNTPSNTPGPLTAWVVEGWVEERGPKGTKIQLALVDAERWVQTRVRVWDDARQVTWASEAAGSWLDALVWEIGETV